MIDSHVTQTKIGEWFGLSAVKVGKILARRGLKDRSGPTRRAVLDGYAKEVVTRDQRSFWVWHAEKAALIVDEALEDGENDRIDRLASQVSEALSEVQKSRNEGNDFIADLLAEHAFEGIPSALVSVIKKRL